MQTLHHGSRFPQDGSLTFRLPEVAADAEAPGDPLVWTRTIRTERRLGRQRYIVNFDVDHGRVRVLLCGDFPASAPPEKLQLFAEAEALRWERHLAQQPPPARQTIPTARSAPFRTDHAHRMHVSISSGRKAA